VSVDYNKGDVSFVRMMIPHHETAVSAAAAEFKSASSPEIKELARNILAGQQVEIAQMKTWLNLRGLAEADPDDATEEETTMRKADGVLDADTARIIRAAAGVGPDEPIEIFEIREEITEGAAIVGKGAEPSVTRVIKGVLPAEERFVLGIVLEPTLEMGQPDSQNDVYSAAEIEKAAHNWMQRYKQLGVQHKEKADNRIEILESYIQRGDTVVNGQIVKSGTWCMAVRVVDDQLWADVKAGNFTGFSIGGMANRQPVESTTA